MLLIAYGGQKPPGMGQELGCTHYSPLLVISLSFSNTVEKSISLGTFKKISHILIADQMAITLFGVFLGVSSPDCSNFSSLQVFTTHLRVEEGGMTPITEGHILISDADTKREHLFLLLQRQPQHGAVERGDSPMNGGDRLSCEDLSTLAVRLEEWWLSFVVAEALI